MGNKFFLGSVFVVFFGLGLGALYYESQNADVIAVTPPVTYDEAPLKSAAMIEDILALPAYVDPKSVRSIVPMPGEIGIVESVATKLTTPLGLFEANTYPSTCFPTEENFRERYARDLRTMWNMPLGDFLDDLSDNDWENNWENPQEWQHVIDWLMEAETRHSNGIKVGAALSFPNDVDFEASLTKVWESGEVQLLYQRHMEIIEISTWTAATQYQGDIDYFADFNRNMLDRIRSMIWDNDSNLDFLWAVQQNKDLYEE